EFVPCYGEPQQDLPVDFVVGRVDARRVVDEVGVDPSAAERVLDPAELRAPQVATLADDPSADVAPVDPYRVVRAVAHVRVRFLRRFHVRADAAVPQQVDGCLQDG